MQPTPPPASRGPGPRPQGSSSRSTWSDWPDRWIVLVAGGAGRRRNSPAAWRRDHHPVSLTEFKIDGQLMAPPGAVTLEVTNDNTMQHDLTIADLGKTTGMIQPGETVTLDLGTLDAGK